MKVFIAPKPGKADTTGGIARVVEAQAKWLPEASGGNIELVDVPQHADVLAVHASWWEPPTARQRVVSHCHGLYWAQDNWPGRWYKETNERVIASMRMADAVTCPSEWVAEALRVGGLFRPVVIGHGVDTDDWTPSSTGHKGYILWDKARQDAACDPRPVGALASAMPDMRFLSTFGDSASNVQIIGEHPHREHKLIVQHAMLYLATARETFGISILEALACGVPIVGWNWGGQAEILASSGLKVGWLAPVGDYQNLVQGIRYCVENRDQLSVNARQLAEDKYQWKNVIEEYADLYTSIHAYQGPIKVSVIIPSYNLGRYLGAAIESVLRQDLPREQVEVIVVDDCSTDNSYEIAKTYESKGLVRLARTPHNMNMPGVLNLGLQYAQGQYVMNLDADNMLAPGALRVLVDALDQDRELDIAYGKLKFVLEDGERPDTQVSPDGISGWPPYVASYDAQMAHKNQIPSTSLVRRKVIDQIGGYRHRCFRIGEDPDFWCRALGVGAVARRVTDAVMLLYRMRDDSRSHVQPEWPWESWYTRKPIQIGGPVLAPHVLVSVVIPVGPGHETQGLEDALDSVYNQTFTSWECIVVNDTGKPLIRVPSWVRLLDTGTRSSGVSTARNIGMATARGEALVFLDADDFLENDALAKMYKVFSSYGGKNYVYTDWYKGTAEAVRVDKHDAIDQLANLRHPITGMYPIQIRDKARFDQDMLVGEDWDFILAVLANGYCGVHLPEPLIYYRQDSGHNRDGLKARVSEIRTGLNAKYREKIMACGCQSQQAPASNSQSTAAVGYVSGDSELVLVEFVMPGMSTMSWTVDRDKGGTGHTYRFGSGDGHRLGYVHKADAQYLLGRPEFALADPSNLADI